MAGTDLKISVAADVSQAVSGMNKLAAETSIANQALSNLGTATGATTNSTGSLSSAIGRLGTTTTTAGEGVRNLGEGLGSIAPAATSATSSLADFGSELARQATIFLGLNEAFEFFKDSVKEFEHAQQEASKLTNILSNLGRLDVFTDLKEQAEQLSKTFGTIKSEDVTGVFDQLITYGKLTQNQIEELLPVIINFAAKTGNDLTSATSLIEKALEGNGRALKQFGIDMSDGSNTAERFGIVMSQLAPRVDGAAKAFGETTQGQLKATQVQIDELKKSIGEELEPTVKHFYEAVETTLDGLKILAKDVAGAFNGLKFAFAELIALSTFNFKGFEDLSKVPAALEARNKLMKDWIDVNEQAKSLTDDVNKKGQAAYDAASKAGKSDVDAKKAQVAVIQNLIKANESLQASSLKSVTEYNKQGQAATAAGKAAQDQANLDTTVVGDLYKLLAKVNDTRTLGFGGGKTKTGDDEANKALEIQISLLDQIKKVRDELAKPDNGPVFKREALASTTDDSGNTTQSEAGGQAVQLLQAKLKEAVIKANEGIKDALAAGNKEQAQQIRDNIASLTALTAQEIAKIKFPDVHAPIKLGLAESTTVIDGQKLEDAFQKGIAKFEKQFENNTLEIKIPANFKLQLEGEGFSSEDAQKILNQLKVDFANHTGIGKDGIIPIIPSLEIQWDKALLKESDSTKLIDQLQKSVEGIIKQIQVGVFQTFGTLLGDLVSGEKNPLGKALAALGNLLGEGLKTFGEAVLKAAVTMTLLKKAITYLGKTPALGIPIAIAAIAVGTVIENDLKKQSATAFATGGIVTGPTLGLVGEAGPEVIFPLDRLNSFVKGIGGNNQNITVNGVISGNNLAIVNARTTKLNRLSQ